MNRLKSALSLLALAALATTVPAWADATDDQIERARLLRQLLEQDRVAPAPQASPEANLPGAKLDAQVLRNREQLYQQRSGDVQWRRLLGEQQADRIRQQTTGMPSAAPARAMGFEREQRMRDLSARILEQDRQYRLDSQR